MTSHALKSEIHALMGMARRLRRHSLIATSAAGSGHPTSCFSCADLVAAIFFKYLHYDLRHPKDPHNDRFVLSKGHAAPILWAAWAEAGGYPLDELTNLRKLNSDLEGHPTPNSRYVDVATGSLGQGLSVGLGMALASRLDHVANRIYVLMGDGETAEGSVWEAAALAGYYRAGNLTAIVDVNRLGQSQPTMLEHNIDALAGRFAAFGWHTRTIDGHDMRAIVRAFDEALAIADQPTAIVARTIKGKGVSFLEDVEGYHGKAVPQGIDLEKALTEIGELDDSPEPLKLKHPQQRGNTVEPGSFGDREMPAPEYKPGESIATREAYGKALRKLGDLHPNLVALDGDVKNSTFSLEFLKAHPARFFESFIAEQNMIGVAMGMAALGKVPFASSFACFLERAADQIRMAGISRLNLKLCGSHAGVSIGEDGPSQMALEDLAFMRTVPEAAVLYPSDAVSAERLTELAAAYEGFAYIRTSRPKSPVLYHPGERFEIGGSKVLRSSPHDQATLVSAGVTLHEALKAADRLQETGIRVRVIDLYCIKPIDVQTLREAAQETRLIVTVEDHYPEGGIGEAVLAALANEVFRFMSLAVRSLPRSGAPEELLARAGIDAAAIEQTVRERLQR